MTAFIPWRIPTRPEWLNAAKMLGSLRADAPAIKRVVGGFETLDDLVGSLRSQRNDGTLNSYKAEAYLIEFQRQLHENGEPRVPNRDLLAFREEKLGLEVTTDLYEVWTQCVAMYHANATVPEAVKLLVAGLPATSSTATVEHAVAVVLADDTPFRRRRRLSSPDLFTVRAAVVRQWVRAIGAENASTLEAVERLITKDRDHRLGREPAESYARLDLTMVETAKQLVMAAGFGADARLAYYVFRCLQRISAYAVEGRVQWRAEWLRGARTNPRAIAGASTSQAALGKILHESVLDEIAGHSGAKSTARTYQLRFEIRSGEAGLLEAAQALGLKLTKKGTPMK